MHEWHSWFMLRLFTMCGPSDYRCLQKILVVFLTYPGAVLTSE